MFLLAFFGFLRCSEIAITSKFNPKLHPTISDLSIIDSETIAYFIKQSKTDQERKGHFIYIFNLPSPIQPYQALFSYFQLGNAQAKSTLDPLFVDDSNHPVTRFWFQKHLKLIITQAGLSAEFNFFFQPFISHQSSNYSSSKKASLRIRFRPSVDGHQTLSKVTLGIINST